MLNPTKGKAMLIIGESLSPSESKMEMKKQYIRFIPRADTKLVWVRL